MLAHLLDSLVRVSRRVVKGHFVKDCYRLLRLSESIKSYSEEQPHLPQQRVQQPTALLTRCRCAAATEMTALHAAPTLTSIVSLLTISRTI